MALKLVQKDFIYKNARLFKPSNVMVSSRRNHRPELYWKRLCAQKLAWERHGTIKLDIDYPPGKWNTLDCWSAWKAQSRANYLLTFTKAKQRLDFICGLKLTSAINYWLVEALPPRPNNLEFQKLITKTEFLPDEPISVADTPSDNLLDRLCALANDLYTEQHELLINGTKKILNQDHDDVERWNLHKVVGNLLRSSVSLLSSDKDYLRRCEIDQNVRVESFWKFHGFGSSKHGEISTWELKTKDGKNAGVVPFQYKHMADFQIRTEDPLPEFLPIDDALCSVKEIKYPDYSPTTVDMVKNLVRPVNVSGQWIGSPCQFTSGSIHIMPSKFVEKYEEFGMKYLEEAEVIMAMNSMFGSCAAQAYNQGFGDILDITYPFTTQCIIMNKHHVRFGWYQMNTLQLWNDGNTHQNVMWVSDPIKLLEENENGSKQINKEFVSGFIKFLLLEPKYREINMRPYLPEDPAPTSEFMINTKGEEPEPRTVPLRYEHPKYSIYY